MRIMLLGSTCSCVLAVVCVHAADPLQCDGHHGPTEAHVPAAPTQHARVDRHCTQYSGYEHTHEQRSNICTPTCNAHCYWVLLQLCLSCACSATVLVSAVNFAPSHADSQPGPSRASHWGVLFILLSCLVQASQYVFEEHVMDVEKEHGVPPLLLVGMEGVWGAALMLLVVYPWATMLPGTDQGGCMENMYDTWVMMSNSDTVRRLATALHGQLASSGSTARITCSCGTLLCVCPLC